MPKKEPVTLESLIQKQQKLHAENVARNEENISKLQKRAAEAEGAEKERLEALVALHLSHKTELEAVDPVAIATEKFEQLKSK